MTQKRGVVPVKLLDEAGEFTFSVCTFVTDRNIYRTMLDSFSSHEFTVDNSEFLYFDNTAGNDMDAFRGINLFLRRARGRFVILCHQDIELVDGEQALSQRLVELHHRDPHWALAGNAGGYKLGGLSVRISDTSYGDNFSSRDFPRRVHSLDENFLVLKAEARLATSRHLTGFHFYGADLCLTADFLGHRSYVIDFLLRHRGGEALKSTSNKNVSRARGGFDYNRRQLIASAASRFRPRWIQTTCARVFLSSSPLLNRFLNWRVSLSVAKRFRR